ncbi:uncharacterized protein Z520_07162 [Fonsecaea multimorphosa CBS 102226]|uniref:Uncharacterized protein n=1 Tax=Fonsecaea multimorphosa CBS 102226 TaxID=1442371 RepID=A0A0D2KK97_9EURO|nr:uncharacterized protein Z520_07162 [Fonsecaea multimorphosa CBS 102226]KIX97048.1 hypothetical protein Z520_07162 [Fonsecaea multimorphosa CBS 102226]
MADHLDYSEAEALQMRWTLTHKKESETPALRSQPCRLLVISSFAISLVAAVVLTILTSNSNDHLVMRDDSIDGTKIPLIWRQFAEDVRYAEPPSNQSDTAWSELLPYGQGFVNVDNPRRISARPGIPSATVAGKESFGLSVFHQLHCLYIIRSIFYDNLSGSQRQEHEAQGLAAHHHLLGHARHCFDYLRQSIMCAGDVSYESAIVLPSGKLVNGVDGWGDWHLCRNWDTIWQYAVQHRGQNFSGIV